MKVRLIGYSFIPFVVISLFAACNSGSKSEGQSLADKKFGKLEVEIPASLKDKPEVVAYINEMAKLSDEYALLVDKVAEDAKDFRGKKEEDFSIMDKIKLTKITSETGFKSIEILGKWGEYTEKRMDIQENLTEDEILAFDAIMTRFGERMKQVEARHEDIFKDNTKQ